MNEELRRLWAVHELDERAVKLLAALERYPEERREVERRVHGEHVLLDEHKTRTATLQKERRDLEQRAQALGDEERKFQGQLPMVKKNEEYQALLHEIADRKAKRSDVETEILVKLEEEESVAADLPRLNETLKTVQREAETRMGDLESAEARDRGALEAIDQERETHLAGLSAPTRSRYERVRASRQGRAVVPILKNACGGCFRGQPPQVLQEARRGDRLLSCDGCGRLLIWPPDEH